MTTRSLVAGAFALAVVTVASVAGAQVQTSLLYHAATPQRALLREPFSAPSWTFYLPTEEGVVGLDARDARARRGWTVPSMFPRLTSSFHEQAEEIAWAVNVPQDVFRLRRANTWTWVGLGLGTASVGVSAVFFRLAGMQNFSLAPRQDGSMRDGNGDPSVATATRTQGNGTFFGAIESSVLSPISQYQLRYDNLGDLTLRLGMDSVSSNLFQLLLSPRDNSLRYLRTSVTELPGGWMFSLQGSLR